MGGKSVEMLGKDVNTNILHQIYTEPSYYIYSIVNQSIIKIKKNINNNKVYSIIQF